MLTNDKILIIERRLKDLEQERLLLVKELETLKELEITESKKQQSPATPTPITVSEKISLFLSLFRCREDLYPRLWENRKKGTIGYSPACRNEWITGVCRKPQIKCHECHSRSFEPFTEITAQTHLEGKMTIGSYAIDKDDNCIFLAADFDGSSWKQDASAYQKAASEMGIEVAIEISRSGNGAHAWIFFSEPVPARIARTLGTIVLTRASSNHKSINFNSYDRFFPNQDYLPEGGFGNLIALPLQKNSRNSGTTVFVDESFNPYSDQWNFLATRKRLPLTNVMSIINESLHNKHASDLYDSQDSDILEAEKSISLAPCDNTSTILNETVVISSKSVIEIDLNNIPSRIIYALKRIATFANPKFFELQRLRFSTWNTPRYICCANIDGEKLLLPRGTIDECIKILSLNGARLDVKDERITGNVKQFNFIGVLHNEQEIAVDAMMKPDIGVLVAPPGTGKTVMACAIIARRCVPTLVLVHRKQLIEQWKMQIIKFLGVDKKAIGLITATSKKDKGMIDIAMIQSLTRMENLKELTKQYGMIVIDECHHIPAVSFESMVSQIPSRYFLGLTATPYRKDGLQPIIHMQCGPIRHTINETAPSLDRKVIVKETPFAMQSYQEKQTAIHEVWEAITTDISRTELIAKDIVKVLESGRFPLVLSDRKEHLYSLSKAIKMNSGNNSMNEYIFVGEMGKKARKKALEEIKVSLTNPVKPYILSTSSLIGEGFDLPELDTLFITMPVSFKGRVIQYAGRLHRDNPGKNNVEIYDYCDSSLGLTISMFKKRLSAYREMGYNIIVPESEKIARIIKKARLTYSTTLFTL
ncbi:MAG TPA: DEAD/DEAH box helicase family protein [Spirochaetota bacterium]|nr:DEAD/DEAH box helicase family protein [Spirochaetota bacterium]HPR49672.1 DEAD/DEAH box helicase family protein [Spirochaetota bacterium]